MNTSLIDVPRGLAGVAVASTSVGEVRGEEGFYHYRGHSAVELARSGSFEAVWELLLGTPPDGAARNLPPVLGGVVDRLDLRSALSFLAASMGLRALVDESPEERRADAHHVVAALPTLVASLQRGTVVTPRPELGHAADYLGMVTGEPPSAELARALEQYWILTVDHGFNASTFTARVIASTGADLGACVVGGLGALSGPRHGGSPSRVLDMLDAVAACGDAHAWLQDELRAGRRLMGFGHAVYRAPDPRSELLREVATAIAPERAALARRVELAALELLAGRRLVTNVELYAAVVLEACGIPRRWFTGTFACSRVVGWCAHALEQAEDSKIIRPDAHYVGDPPAA